MYTDTKSFLLINKNIQIPNFMMIVCIHMYVHSLHFCIICNFPIDITVSFNQSVYSVNESDGPVQPVLILSSPSSTEVTVMVFSTGGSATGE